MLTHLEESMENLLKNYWVGEVFLNCHRGHARRVAILLSNNFKYVFKTEKTLKVIYWSWILQSNIQNVES